MSNYDTFWIVFVFSMAALLGGLYVFEKAHGIVTERERVKSDVIVPQCNTPCRCRPLLNLGTWEWAECLGVGRK